MGAVATGLNRLKSRGKPGDTKNMKLGKVTSNDPVERQALGIHKSTVQQLQQYRAFYQNVHGDEISMSLLVEEICKRFMHEDKSFQKFVAAQEKTAPAASTATQTSDKRA